MIIIENQNFMDMQKTTKLEQKKEFELPEICLYTNARVLVGREKDVSAIKDKLLRDDLQLMMITGMGGVGKTSVAIEVMHQLQPAFSLSLYLDIVQISNEESVLSLIARSLGIMEGCNGNLFYQLAHAIGMRQILLLIDNCEYMIEDLKQICLLLEVCSHLKVILVSRVAISAKFGNSYYLSPLEVPSLEQMDQTNELLQLSAIRLFIMKMKAATEKYQISEEDIEQIGKLCKLLEGIPLAIEIVAAKVVQLGSFIECFPVRLDCINNDSTDVSARQHSLHDTIEWSYSLLSHQEKELLCRFSVFPGCWALQQAVGICSGYGIEGKDVLVLTNSLVKGSFVVEKRDSSGEARYCLLDNVRQSARQHLKDFNMEVIIKRRHRDWFLALAEQMEPDSWNGNMVHWLKQIKLDFYNYRAALEFCTTNEEEAAAGIRIWSAYARYFTINGYISYEVALAKVLLALSKEKSKARMSILLKVGQFLNMQGKFMEAKIYNDELLILSVELGDFMNYALALLHVAADYNMDGQFTQAETAYLKAINLLRSEKENSSVCLYTALFATGEFYRLHGEYLSALKYNQEAIALAKVQGDPYAMAYYSLSQGILLLSIGEVSEADKILAESIMLCCEMEYLDLAPRCLDYLGHIAWKKGNGQKAVDLFGLASTIREWTGSLIWSPDPEFEEIMKSIGDQVREISKSMISDYSPEDILALITAVSRNCSMNESTDLKSHQFDTDNLSQRELEIAGYIAMGLTNQKIADKLFLSKRTVDAHIRNILSKLELVNRSQISAWYTDHQKQ